MSSRPLLIRLRHVAIPPNGPTPCHSSAYTGIDAEYPFLRGPEITSSAGATAFRTDNCRSHSGTDLPSHSTGRRALSRPIRRDLPPASSAPVKVSCTHEFMNSRNQEFKKFRANPPLFQRMRQKG